MPARSPSNDERGVVAMKERSLAMTPGGPAWGDGLGTPSRPDNAPARDVTAGVGFMPGCGQTIAIRQQMTGTP
ncbi:MAG: hypothetical protein LBQ62_10385 [Candidatus Accumulibacter sp.]|nr:hypothetical protein [Accumulibacter sp.]